MILYFIFKLVLSFIFSLPSSVKTTLTEDDLDGRHINAGLVMFWVTALAGFLVSRLKCHIYKCAKLKIWVGVVVNVVPGQ